MITITKEKYGRDPWNKRDVYRIRVVAKDDKQKFNDFHLRIDFPRRKGLNFFFGNNKDQVLILYPTNKKLGWQQFHKKATGKRRWRGTYKGWKVPFVSQGDNDSVYLSFLSEDCKKQKELIFDLAVDDITRITDWWATRDCNKIFVPGKSDIVQHDKAVEKVEVVEKDPKTGKEKKVKKIRSKIKDFKIPDEKKRDKEQAKGILKSVFEQFDKEIAIESIEEMLLEVGYIIEIEEEPLFVDLDGNERYS